MTAVLPVDGPVAVSLRRFSDSVHSFADRRPVWSNGVARWEPPIYGKMRTALSGRSAFRTGRRAADSRIPARTGVLDWLVTVDQTVAGWGPGAGTVDRLKALTHRSWRPQDSLQLERWSDQLADWATEAATVLGDAKTVVPLRGIACPVCGQQHVFRHRDGEYVRTPALTVSEDGAECGSCRAAWTPEQFGFLATLLGCEALPV